MKKLLALTLLLIACPASPDGLSISDITIPSYSPEETMLILRGDSAYTVRVEIGYDNNLLRIRDVTTEAYFDTAYVDTSTIIITLTDTLPMTDVLAYLTVEAVTEQDIKTPLTFQDVQVDSLDLQLTDGWVTIRPYSGHDVTLDGQVTEADAWDVFLAVQDKPHQIAQLHPLWWLHRANLHEDYLPNGYPLIDLWDVLTYLRRYE